MSKLINVITKEGVPVVGISEMATNLKRSRRNLIRDTENIIFKLGGIERCSNLFIETKVQNPQNKQWYKEYLLTRDGFLLLVMGFTGAKAIEWKIKYIEAFNSMEEALREPYGDLSKELRAIFTLDKKTSEIEKRITEVEETAFILPFQKKSLINARTKKVLSICGGKNSLAYKNKSFRSRVYCDLSKNVKNIYNINEYDAIPRKKFNEAMEIIENYALPIHLQYEKQLIIKD